MLKIYLKQIHKSRNKIQNIIKIIFKSSIYYIFLNFLFQTVVLLCRCLIQCKQDTKLNTKIYQVLLTFVSSNNYVFFKNLQKFNVKKIKFKNQIFLIIEKYTFFKLRK